MISNASKTLWMHAISITDQAMLPIGPRANFFCCKSRRPEPRRSDFLLLFVRGWIVTMLRETMLRETVLRETMLRECSQA
jgi:hypothetical protein